VGFSNVAQSLPPRPVQQVVTVSMGEGVSVGGRFVEVVVGGEERVKFARSVGGVVEVDEYPATWGGVVQQVVGLASPCISPSPVHKVRFA
jgi:hypothetical protein